MHCFSHINFQFLIHIKNSFGTSFLRRSHQQGCNKEKCLDGMSYPFNRLAALILCASLQIIIYPIRLCVLCKERYRISVMQPAIIKRSWRQAVLVLQSSCDRFDHSRKKGGPWWIQKVLLKTFFGDQHFLHYAFK